MDAPDVAASFDVALSNGLLNLIPDKPEALREIFRVLIEEGLPRGAGGGRLH